MSGLRFLNKVTIVTGGSKGIGAGIVEEFVRNGSKVVFCCRNPTEGEAFEKKMNEIGIGEAAFKACDVNKEDQLRALVDFTVEKYGQIDCLVNNAGYHPLPNTIDHFSGKDLMDLFQLNVVSYFLMSKFCLPYLRKTQGSIINVSSLVGSMGQKNAVTYCTTKGAIHAMTRALAIDEGVHNVRVNSISPGGIWTPLFEEWVKVTSDPAKTMQCEVDQQHIRRLGTVEECGKLALFLAADATYTTGTDNIISGGSELGYGNKYVRPT